MTLNERILDFLDGSLPADDEAELLHRLSVSPEKRGLLRDFMEQRALIAREIDPLVLLKERRSSPSTWRERPSPAVATSVEIDDRASRRFTVRSRVKFAEDAGCGVL